MKSYFKLSFVFVLLLVVFNSFAKTPSVQVNHVKFFEEESSIIIQYQLISPPGKKCHVSVKVSDDSGETFAIIPVSLKGDVGKGIHPGNQKEIIWHVMKDFPDGLSGDDFVFAVDAELQSKSKWPFYIVGASVVGGAAYYFSQIQSENAVNDNRKSSLIIEMPSEY